MPESPVNVTNLTSGVPIAAELVSLGTTTTAYAQQVKLLDGTPGGTTGIPGNTAGLFVQFSSVPQVAISGGVSLSGTVVASLVAGGTVVAQISSTVLSVNTAPTVAGASITIQQGVSVSLPALSGVVAASTAQTSNVFAVPVIVVNGQTGTATPVMVTVTSTALASIVPGGSISAVGSILGTAVVSVVPGLSVLASITISAALGTVITILGTQVVSVVPGLSVTISGLPVTISGIVPVTTAASVSVSGLPVWMNPTQGVLASIAVSQTVGTVVTLLGTVAVNVVAGGAGGGSVTTTTPPSNFSAQVMRIAGGQDPTAPPVFVSQINPPAGGGGSVTTTTPPSNFSAQVMRIAGGQDPTAPPVFVSQINPPAGGGGSVTTTTPPSNFSAQVVRIAGGQDPTAPPVFVTVSGTAVVSVVPGVSVTIVGLPVTISGIVPVTTAASVSVSGLPVWLNPTQSVNIGSIVSTVLVNVVAGGAAPGTTVTGQTSLTAQLVWLAQTQTLAVVSTIATILGTQVVTIAQTSVIASIQNVVPVTTAASVSVSGLPVWLNPTQSVNIGSIVSTVLVNIVAGAAGGGSVVTTQAGGTSTGQLVWLAATETMALVSTVGTVVTILGTQVVTIAQTSVIASIQNVVPVTTAASVSVSGLPVWLNPTQSVNIGSIVSTVLVNVVAGGAAPGTTVTGQTSLTAQLVWLAQTQTMALVSTVGTVATVLGTAVVTIAQTSVIASIQNVVPVTTAASVSVSGLPVWLNPTQSVNIGSIVSTVLVNVVAGGAAPGTTVTGQTSLTAQLVWLAQTQTLAVVSTIATILGTQVVTIAQTSVIASIQNVTPVTTAASVSVTGLPVWLNPTQSVNIGSIVSTVLVNVVAGGAAPGTTVTGQTSLTAQLVWLAQTQTLAVVSTVATVLGTVVVSVVPGVSVTISGLPVTISGIVPVTTAASVSVSGLPVWLNPTQSVNIGSIVSTVLVNVVAGGAAPGTTVTGQTSLTAQLVWLAQTQTLALVSTVATVATVLGTVGISGTVNVSSTVQACIVAMPPGLLTTGVPSISAQGMDIWLVGGQSTTANPVFVSQINPPAAGGGSVVTTQAGGTSTGQLVWLAATQTIASILSTVNVAIVAGAGGGGSVVTTQAGGTSTGQLVWLAATQTMSVTVSGTVVASIVPGVSVTISGQTVVATVNLFGGDIQAVATTSALASSTQVMLQSVYVNGVIPSATLGTSGWTINSGSALVVYGLIFGWSQPAANNQATFMLMVTTSGATLSTVTPAWAQVTFTSAAALSTIISTGWMPGTYHGMNTSITSMQFPWVIQGPAVVGIAVALTSSGATVYASMNAQVVPTVPFTQIVQIAGVDFTTGAAAAAATAMVVAIGRNVQIQNVAGSMSTTQPPSGVTGMKVWAGQPVNIPVMIMVTSTAIAQSATAYLMTVWTGSTVAAAGTSLYAVPAGQNLRILNNQGIVTTSAVVGGSVQMVIAFGTNAASLNSASFRTQGMAALAQLVVTALPVSAGILGGAADVGAGATISPFIIASTAAVLQNMVVQGFLF